MKRHYSFYLIFFLAGESGLNSCTKHNSQPVSDPPETNNVYIAITDVSNDSSHWVAKYWAKDKLISLENKNIETSTGICVSGNDVYVSGNSWVGNNHFAVYWKNGQQVIVGDSASISTGIAVDGTDVYVSGRETTLNNTYSQACYWKNGVFNAFPPDGFGNTNTCCITVSSGDVYVGGYQEINSPYYESLRYWKNGVMTKFTDGAYITDMSSIFVSDGDVYISGNEYTSDPQASKVIYWKNGISQILTDGSTRGYEDGIFVSGEDVYACGGQQTSSGNFLSYYWKNGVAFPLSDTGPGTVTDAIAVVGSDVYVAGKGAHVCYWRNGKSVVIPTQSLEASPTGMVVTKP